jgi:kynurenine formamidase
MGGVGENRVNWITEVISGTTQLGTHLDALSHLQLGGHAYNGRHVDDLASPAGVTALGVDTVPQIVTRGFLVDVSHQGLREGGVIDLGDVDGTLLRVRKQASTICGATRW